MRSVGFATLPRQFRQAEIILFKNKSPDECTQAKQRRERRPNHTIRKRRVTTCVQHQHECRPAGMPLSLDSTRPVSHRGGVVVVAAEEDERRSCA